MPTSSDPTGALRELFRGERPADHPTGEQLAAYQERRLSSAETEAVRNHLAACPDCAGQLLDLAALLEAEAASPALSQAETHGAWERQRARRAGSAPVVPLAPRRKAPVPRREWALAAGLALALGAGALVWLRPGPTPTPPDAPRGSGSAVELDPLRAIRGGASSPPPKRLTFAVGEEHRRVTLNSRLKPSPSGYEAQLVAPDGGVILTLSAHAANAAGDVHLDLPRRVLPEGEYELRVRLSAPAGHEEYALRIDNPSGQR